MSSHSNSLSQNQSGPPRVDLVFRVGVVGHRPNRLKNANEPELAQRVREILLTVQQAVSEHYAVKVNADRYSDAKPQLRALSPLAEGVDRIFASAAIDIGYSLTAILPFAIAEYEQDFTAEKELVPNSLEAFRSLLNQADTVFELDGTRSDASYAYQTAGEVVLNQSDILIVVWDGERKNLRGGTEVILDTALGRGIPVAWIDAKAPHHWQLLTERRQLRDRLENEGAMITLRESSDLSALKELTLGLLGFPKASGKSHHGHQLLQDDPALGWKTFVNERQPRLNPAILWKWFRNILGENHWSMPAIRVTPYEESVMDEWPRQTDHPVASTINRLRPFYAWPDKLADQYADRYRSAFVLAYLLAAFAVAFALAPYALGMAGGADEKHSLGDLVFAVLEALAICTIIALVLFGRWRRWHQRWLDYRLLAEIIRHQRIVAPLGGMRAVPTVPAHLASYGNPASSWMGWYARSLERSIGLPTARVDREYLAHSLSDLEFQLKEQVSFHEKTVTRCETIEHRLHWTELVLFGSTFIFCLLHIFGEGLPYHIPGRWLTIFCGFLPVLGASLAGIVNQGEFRRIAQQSRSMVERLRVRLSELDELSQGLAKTAQHPEQWSADIANSATTSARIMVTEVLGWRVIFQDRPLNPP